MYFKNLNLLLIRTLDILLSTMGIIILSPIFIFVYILIYFDNRSPLFFQERVGIKQKVFILIKFRSMKISTNNCATHLVDPRKITNLGKFLRKTKLDELPQLWNVLKGDMSMIGPRPCLITQKELIKNRIKYNLYSIKPGITGIAQINRIDMSDPELLAKIESKMIIRYNLFFYFYYIILTLLGLGSGDRVKNINTKN